MTFPLWPQGGEGRPLARTHRSWRRQRVGRAFARPALRRGGTGTCGLGPGRRRWPPGGLRPRAPPGAAPVRPGTAAGRSPRGRRPPSRTGAPSPRSRRPRPAPPGGAPPGAPGAGRLEQSRGGSGSAPQTGVLSGYGTNTEQTALRWSRAGPGRCRSWQPVGAAAEGYLCSQRASAFQQEPGPGTPCSRPGSSLRATKTPSQGPEAAQKHGSSQRLRQGRN